MLIKPYKTRSKSIPLIKALQQQTIAMFYRSLRMYTKRLSLDTKFAETFTSSACKNCRAGASVISESPSLEANDMQAWAARGNMQQ